MKLGEKSSRLQTQKSNRVGSVQTHMRRANLGNMFAPLLASGWINQLHAQTPPRQLMLKSEKYFMKLIRRRRATEDTIISAEQLDCQVMLPDCNLWIRSHAEIPINDGSRVPASSMRYRALSTGSCSGSEALSI